jgi:predicted ATP-dependent endonuclease of OLD family
MVKTGEERITIKELGVSNFKAFARFRVYLKGQTILVGPNNAGKSTVIEAARIAARLLKLARNRSPSLHRRDLDHGVQAYPIPGLTEIATIENLRHEFTPSEVRIDVKFSNRVQLHAVWPEDDSDDIPGGFFYLEDNNGKQPIKPKQVRECVPLVGVVPTLSPIEHREALLQTEYVASRRDTRLASRHFRNHLRLLRDGDHGPGFSLEGYKDFVEKYCPDATIVDLEGGFGFKSELDCYYQEASSRTRREVAWAGDGMQIWWQVLLHLYLLKDRDVVVLDEPDVFLHADLQRRLVHVLEEHSAQTILATHSAEVLAEADERAISWIDKARKTAKRIPDTSIQFQLGQALGTNFNLGLARALRARLVLFVEGADMKVLRLLARAAGARTIATETGVAVVPLGGFSNWDRIEPFTWMKSKLLEDAVRVYVILDRDYRSPERVEEIVSRLNLAGVEPHVWDRKELESYLLEPNAIARLSNMKSSWVSKALSGIADGMKSHVMAQTSDAWEREKTGAKKHSSAVKEEVFQRFEQVWSAHPNRVCLCPAKQVLTELNKAIASSGKGKPVTVAGLARAMRREEIDPEMLKVLLRVDSLCSDVEFT